MQQAPAYQGYPDIGKDIDNLLVKPVDAWAASVQGTSHDARLNARDWASDASNSPWEAAGKSIDYAFVALGDTLVQAGTGAVRFFTDPNVREGVANTIDHPGAAAAQVAQHIQSMDSEDWGTAGFGVLAGGAGILGKLNTAAKETALAEALPRLSESARWQDYRSPSSFSSEPMAIIELDGSIGQGLGRIGVDGLQVPDTLGTGAIGNVEGAAAEAPSFASVYAKAPAAKAEIDALADNIASMFDGATVAKAPIKSEVRALQKLNDNPWIAGDPTLLNDLARNTIVVSPSQVDAVAAQLTQRGADVRVITADSNPLGYSGVNSTIPTNAGILGEIQVNTPAMIYAKESEPVARQILGDDVYNRIARQTSVPGGLGHHLYEQYRVLLPTDPRAAAIAAQSRDYYKLVRMQYGD